MKINLDNFQKAEINDSFDYDPRYRRKKKKKKPKFFRFIVCLIVSLIIVGLIGYWLIRFFIGPIAITVEGLPADFPDELEIYDIGGADISLQTVESRQKIASGLKAMPDWALTLFLNILSDDLKTRLTDNFGDEIGSSFGVTDLKEALKTVDLEKAKTINLSWQGLDKTKEELAAYYKQKLTEADFEFKEDLKDYQINLGFWKNGIFGIMSFADRKNDSVDYSADADITINYFNQLNEQ